jgi:hypothetical protein
LQIGINLWRDYHGYGGENTTQNLHEIEHPLMPLFNHSDCDGELSVQESKEIIKGLTLVIENFDESFDSDEDFIERVKQFKNGLIDAVKKNEIVEFY